MSDRLRFGRFELLPTERQLLDNGYPVALGARAFDLLLALIQRRDRLVAKSELLDVVWPGLVVEEANLPVQVSGLRKLIGPQAIATVPGRGYRFAMTLHGGDTMPYRGEAPHVPPLAHTNVPAAVDILIGRDADVDELPHWIAAHRLVTLLGPGGIGKTRLAQAVGVRMSAATPMASGWVDLAPLSSIDQVAVGIATAARLQLGPGLHRHNWRGYSRPARCCWCWTTANTLPTRCESGARGPARRCAVRIVATSQVALKVDGEHLYLLSPLAMPPPGVSLATARQFAAVQLLEHRARAADPRFSLTESTVGQAIDLCHQL